MAKGHHPSFYGHLPSYFFLFFGEELININLNAEPAPVTHQLCGSFLDKKLPTIVNQEVGPFALRNNAPN